MKERRTSITGHATVVFGGGIGAGLTRCDDGSVLIALCEMKTPVKTGEQVTKDMEHYDFQVFMNFDTLESLNVVRGWLDSVEDLLKGRGGDVKPDPPTFEESQGEKSV